MQKPDISALVHVEAASLQESAVQANASAQLRKAPLHAAPASQVSETVQ